MGIGAGTLVVPVACVVRRPDPGGPGRPCREQLTWLQVLRDRTWAVLPRRCRRRPAPWVVADRWLGDSAWRAPIQLPQQGTLVVEGKRRYVFVRPDGRRVQGQARVTPPDWPWRDSLQVPGLRDARCTATSATDGRVTLVLVDNPGAERFSWRCLATTISAPRLLRAWGRRSGLEQTFRTLKHLLAAEACQVQTEDASYGPLVWRWLAGLVLRYTVRFRVKDRVTREASVFSLKPHWRFLTSASLE